jgi:protein-S-isoprenylcysteine O-methyltransferase Ste14
VNIWLASPWNQRGWIIIALSVIPAVGAFYLFDRKQTTANPFQPQKATTLVTNGVYRYPRNPMYLALLMLLTGWALYLGSLVTVLFLPLFVLIINHQQIQRLAKIYSDWCTFAVNLLLCPLP